MKYGVGLAQEFVASRRVFLAAGHQISVRITVPQSTFTLVSKAGVRVPVKCWALFAAGPRGVLVDPDHPTMPLCMP